MEKFTWSNTICHGIYHWVIRQKFWKLIHDESATRDSLWFQKCSISSIRMEIACNCSSWFCSYTGEVSQGLGTQYYKWPVTEKPGSLIQHMPVMYYMYHVPSYAPQNWVHVVSFHWIKMPRGCLLQRLKKIYYSKRGSFKIVCYQYCFKE